MTQKDKLVMKFFAEPTSVKYSYIIQILEMHGFELIVAKGSHVKFKHPKLESDFVIPVHNNECKAFYKRQACVYVRKVQK